MKRPYLALATFALVAGASPATGLMPRAWADGLFSSAPVNAASFAVLARPVGSDDWNLVVLEQQRSRPFCWTPRPDGLVDPTLNRFDYTGICGRFIDSNGFSLRIGETDLNHAFRLRLEQQRGELRLLASSPSQDRELLVGRGVIPRRDRDLFVSLQLEPGWDLRRRVFGGRSLNHIYFNNPEPLDTLIAASRGRTPEALAQQQQDQPIPPLVPPPLGRSQQERAASFPPTEGLRPALPRDRFRTPPAAAPADRGTPTDFAAEAPSPGVVSLQVIPYQERMGPEARVQPSSDPYAQAQGL
ncbi:MAG: DUF3747 domain-containing protein [Cyanobacteriota bacterium]|nr:DUF3747 domain-containing protein [Cyanobacteriota bacterium]